MLLPRHGHSQLPARQTIDKWNFPFVGNQRGKPPVTQTNWRADEPGSFILLLDSKEPDRFEREDLSGLFR